MFDQVMKNLLWDVKCLCNLIENSTYRTITKEIENRAQAIREHSEVNNATMPEEEEDHNLLAKVQNMSSEAELKAKIKKIFLSYPEHKGLLGIYPEGPLKMVDDAMGRCFRFYDVHEKEFLSISVVEKQFLPKEIQKYFHLKKPEREIVAKKAMSEYINMMNSASTPNEIVATEIIESIREWVSNLTEKE
jgi:hypothetical protein